MQRKARRERRVLMERLRHIKIKEVVERKRKGGEGDENRG